jgi:membrane protease YdiL (CAAX protease family)
VSATPDIGGELCGVCGAPLRTAARFCGRCGAEQGLMVPRDGGAGRALQEPVAAAPYEGGRGLVIALVAYFASLVPCLILLAASRLPTVSEIDTGELAIGGAALAGMIVLGRKAWAGLRPPRLRRLDAAIAIAGVAAIVGLVQLFAYLAPTWIIDESLLFKLQGYGLAAALVSTALIPAVAEELLFRGVIMTGLGGVFGTRTTVAVSAMMFATVHMSMLSWPHLCLLGVLLGVARVRTGSIWPGVLIHGVYNAIIICLSW